MEILASDQFQINEIIRKLSKSHLKANNVDPLDGILVKISKEFGAFQIWVYVMQSDKDFKTEDLDRTALFIESIRTDRLVQNVFIGGVSNPDEIESSRLTKRKSRKPGPDLRPH